MNLFDNTMTSKYDLIIYELIKTCESDYECNDMYIAERDIEIANNATDREILNLVQAKEGITISCFSSVDFIEFLNADGYPCARLQLIH